ncbi:MAG: MXAN_6521/LA_1396 family lipoprotein [Myxococcaceae bacterium]
MRGALGLAVLAAALAAPGCSAVKMHRVRPDYEQVDKTRTKRLVVVTQPLPDGQEKVGQLFSLVARRYVNQKRNFIVKKDLAQAGAFQPAALCGEGLEGVLWLQPTLKRAGEGVEASVRAMLLRCSDGQEVWAADAGGSFASTDELLKQVTADYAAELGAEVTAYVAPAFNLLRPTLDTLPDPVLTDDDVTEKIELGE